MKLIHRTATVLGAITAMTVLGICPAADPPAPYGPVPSALAASSAS